MLSIARLFGKSPFAPLQTHMNKVGSCIEKLTRLFEVLLKDETEKVERLVTELSQLEHEADLTKNDIRNHLPKSLFLPIDRSHFLEILSIQDSIADQAEAIGLLIALRPLAFFDDFRVEVEALFKKSVDVFWDAKHIIEEMDGLLESSFGGIEAEKVKGMVEQVAQQEYTAERLQNGMMKQLFAKGDPLTAPAFTHWLRLIEEIGNLAHLSEKLANRIRMVLELK